MPTPLQIALFVLVLTAGVSDIRVRRIPNWLTLAGVLTGIALNTVALPHGCLVALSGLFCAVAVYAPLYALRGMGAGDVKLMAAVGAITGPGNWLWVFLVTALVAGVISLAVIVVRRRVAQTAANLQTIVLALGHRHLPATVHPSLSVRSPRALRMPHGAFIAIGSLLFLVLSKAGRL